MNLKRKISKEINKIEPSQEILTKIKTSCGIPSVRQAKKPFYKSILFRSLVPVFACLVLMVTCFSVVFTMPKQTDITSSLVLVDMNSVVSLQMQDEVVVAQAPMNDSAQVLLAGNDYTEKSLKEALVLLVGDAQELGILKKGEQVSVSRISKQKKGQHKCSELFNGTNSLQQAIGSDFVVANSCLSEKQFIENVAEKYDCKQSYLEKKTLNEIAQIYYDYDAKKAEQLKQELLQKEQELKQKYENLMQNDFVFNFNKNLSEKLDLLLEKLQQYLQGHDEISQSIMQLLSLLSGELNVEQDDLQLSQGLYDIVAEKLGAVKEKLKQIEQGFQTQYDAEFKAFKIDFLNQNV